MRFALKTQDFSADWFNVMLYDTSVGEERNFTRFEVATTQDWTRYDFVANSGESSALSLYLGVWGESSGDAWFDDVRVEEVALVNLIRREGASLEAHGPDGTLLTEGQDIDPISDPLAGPAGIFDDWHEPPAVTLPASSGLSPGDAVTISYHAVAPIYGYQVGACLSDPGVWTWVEENLTAVSQAFPDTPGLFFQHDEMRHLNSCSSCRSRALDAGELLAWHMQEATTQALAIAPEATLYTWSDMWDPHHNAHDGY